MKNWIKAKNLAGLKIHIRRIHSFPEKLFECDFCNFTSKTESEIKKHNKTFNITHSHLDYNQYFEEVNCEIFALREIGYMLLGMQHFNSDMWNLWMDKNFFTPGKNS